MGLIDLARNPLPTITCVYTGMHEELKHGTPVVIEYRDGANVWVAVVSGGPDKVFEVNKNDLK